jgi:aminoglycoside phosphotransferase (APT) family kinase protein
MGREYRVLSALWRVFPPAPRPFLHCDDPAVIGAPFYVMERRHGLAIRTSLPPGVSDDPALRRRISEGVVDTLAALHAVDWEAAGLAGLGRPAGFVERQVRGWAERYERAKTQEVPAIRDLARWLAERIPASAPPVLLHNDYKLDNLLLDRGDPGRVAAVLDWEMATLGDPLVDLGLLLCYWADPADPPARRQSISQVTAEPGFFTRREVLDRSGAATGGLLRDLRPLQGGGGRPADLRPVRARADPGCAVRDVRRPRRRPGRGRARGGRALGPVSPG